MNADFGKISNYVDGRGFGFVRGLLSGNSSEIFFHIRTVKRADPKLAERITKDPFEEYLFWFETEETAKGEQVRGVLTSEQVRRGAIQDASRLESGIEGLWRNINIPKAEWLEGVTADLLGDSRALALAQERTRLEVEERKRRENARKEMEARLAEKEERDRRQIETKKAQEAIEEREFEALVDEMKQMNFSHSSQVSNYIVTRRLGLKYRNISGVLQMELNGTIWDFKGGFPPKIYARLCDALELSNEGTRARPVAFESFDSIEGRSRKK